VEKKMKKASYGLKKQENSKFIIAAPHGFRSIENDEFTDDIADRVSRILQSSAVINNRVSREEDDFNKPGVSRNLRNRSKEMQDFYRDIEQYVRQAKARYGSAVVVMIHGMKDSHPVDIDIGCGLIEDEGQLKSSSQYQRDHPDERSRGSGVVRANRNQVKKLRASLQEQLPDQEIGIGQVFSACDREGGIQYFRGRQNIASIQIECSRELRKNNPQELAEVIAYALQQAYDL